MREFREKVAVVTGAASGIGLALARKFARAGMHVVLADIEAPALATAESALRSVGASVVALRTDVSQAADVEALAAKTISTFGAVHLLCNNAGVGGTPGPIWEHSLDDWNWTMGANLYSVIHGIRTFVPIMLRQGAEGHIVNTASVAGLLSSPSMGIYNATKHAVVTISEVLAAELEASGAPIGVSVLCPGWVKTRIMESARNRPGGPPQLSGRARGWQEGVRNLVENGISPEAVADRVFASIKDQELYILTHPEFNDQILERVQRIISSADHPHAQRTSL